MNSVFFFLKILCFVSKESLNIPEYRCLLIGRVKYFCTIEHAVENISVTLLSLVITNSSKIATPFRTSNKLYSSNIHKRKKNLKSHNT